MNDASIDLSPESICGTVIDTQEALLTGDVPNADQIRACRLANASEAMLTMLHKLIRGLPPQKVGSPIFNAALDAVELLKCLPKPRNERK